MLGTRVPRSLSAVVLPPELLAELEAGSTLLAPTQEIAAAIFDAIERHHRAAGHEVWATPRIRDFSSWLREQHERRCVDGTARLRCLQDFEERYLWREVLATDGRDTEFLDPAGAAQAARRARAVMRAHGIPSSALEASAGEEAQLLVRWIDAFERRCRDLGCVGTDELLGEFPVAPEPIACLESPAWRPAAQEWLRRHARAIVEPARSARTAAWTCHAASPERELAAAADWLCARSSERAEFRAWMLIPDLATRRAEVIDAFDATLAPQRLRFEPRGADARYAIAGGTPLADYPQVAAALEWLDLARGSVAFERFSALLRTAGATPAETVQAALIDIELRRIAPVQMTLRAWLALAQRCAPGVRADSRPLIERLFAALDALEEGAQAAPMSRWVARWLRAFEMYPWTTRAVWSSGEFQSVERFRELLASLAAADALYGTLAAGQAAAELARAARDRAFQPQTGIAPIWVTGAVGDPWLCYDALWIAGLSADAWPPPIEPTPLIPTDVQRHYGIENASAATRLQAARDLGRRWAHRAPSAVFSFADPVEGRPTTASRLIDAGSASLHGSAVPRPLWQFSWRQAPALEHLVDSRAPVFAAAERTRGVATLRAQSMCAFRGFAETRLRCERLRRPVAGFDPSERGRLVHAALEHVWGELRDSAALCALPPPARAMLIDAAVEAALQEALARRDPGPRWHGRERRRTVRLLSRWLDLEARRTPFSVERIEQDRQFAQHAGIEFSCRIDRVDRLSDGARLLIDYKTNTASVDWRGERPANPQLPLYAGLVGDGLVAVAYGQVSAAECRFLIESERDGVILAERRRTALEGAADMRALVLLWKDRLDRLAAEFRDGRATLDPIPGACESCYLHAFCRIADRDLEAAVV